MSWFVMQTKLFPNKMKNFSRTCCSTEEKLFLVNSSPGNERPRRSVEFEEEVNGQDCDRRDKKHSLVYCFTIRSSETTLDYWKENRNFTT